MEFVPELVQSETLSLEMLLALGGVARAKSALAELAFERRYGVDTSGMRETHELGITLPGAYRYEPSGWLALPTALSRREVGPDDVLVDLGCGMGRVVLQAARRYPLKRVVGVELSEQLVNGARRNLERQRRLRCSDVELVCADAAEWTMPADATIAYMHNPFTGTLFGQVLKRLFEHVDRCGRPLKLIYVNPVEEWQLIVSGRAREVRLPRSPLSLLRPQANARLRRYDLLPRF